MRVAAPLLASLPATITICERGATLPPPDARHTARPMASMVRHAARSTLTPTIRPTFGLAAEAAALETSSLRLAPLPCLLGSRDVLARVEGVAVDAAADEAGALLAGLVDGTLTVRTLTVLSGLDEITARRAFGRLLARGAVRVAPTTEEPAESGVRPAVAPRAAEAALPPAAAPEVDFWSAPLKLRRER
jgi:hypothetical protein